MNELEKFKEDVITGYIHPYIDRLLDLMNDIKKAQTFDEIAEKVALARKSLDGLNKEDSKKI